jgi:hypothetical protein
MDSGHCRKNGGILLWRMSRFPIVILNSKLFREPSIEGSQFSPGTEKLSGLAMQKMRSRAKTHFPSVLLTLISIIQALALELMWSKIVESDFL